MALLAAQALPAAAQDAPDGGSSKPPTGSPALAVAPLRFEFDKTGAGQTLRLINTGTMPLVVQMRLFAWDQSPEEDKFSPSRAITISPAIASIAPGRTQIVRMTRTTPPSAGEKPFRLTVDQLPDPKVEETTAASTRIRFVLPVFIDRDLAPAAQLGWRLGPDRIEVNNSGGQSVRIASLKLIGPGGRPLTFDGAAGLRYVHGGRTIAWKLPNACAQGALRVTAEADGAAVDVQPAPCA